ncbi:MAG TPA: hypothetical protein VFE94_03785 [Candidatus Paceibacterota bacterium]|nr:hypothetical protein [Candidatus Paceibacterota bacterium]
MKHILSLLVTAGIVSLAVVGVTAKEAFAQDTTATPTVVEEQAALQEIAQQLQDIEVEVNRLSLLVNKLVLEKQAVALQERLLAEMSSPSPAPVVARPAPVAVAPTPAPLAPAPAPIAQAPVPAPTPAPREDNVFGGVTLTPEPEAAAVTRLQDRFMSITSPLRNLGGPELLTLAILAVLGTVVLARRARRRGGAAPLETAETSNQPTGSGSTVVTPQVTQSQSQEPRQGELRRGVAWK